MAFINKDNSFKININFKIDYFDNINFTFDLNSNNINFIIVRNINFIKFNQASNVFVKSFNYQGLDIKVYFQVNKVNIIKVIFNMKIDFHLKFILIYFYYILFLQ